MISKRQEATLRSLAGQAGCSIHINKDEIKIENVHGQYTLSNDKSRYQEAATLLEQMVYQRRHIFLTGQNHQRGE